LGLKTGRVAVGILAWFGGWFLVEYFRVQLVLIPGLTFIMIAAVLFRVLHGARRRFAVAISLQASHVLWMIVGAVVARHPLAFIESVVVVSVLVLLLLRPGWPAAILLACYNLPLVILHFLQLGSGLHQDIPLKTIQLHILIRVAILFSLAVACLPKRELILEAKRA
jgi:hypothetical protein